MSTDPRPSPPPNVRRHGHELPPLPFWSPHLRLLRVQDPSCDDPLDDLQGECSWSRAGPTAPAGTREHHTDRIPVSMRRHSMASTVGPTSLTLCEPLPSTRRSFAADPMLQCQRHRRRASGPPDDYRKPHSAGYLLRQMRRDSGVEIRAYILKGNVSLRRSLNGALSGPRIRDITEIQGGQVHPRAQPAHRCAMIALPLRLPVLR